MTRLRIEWRSDGVPLARLAACASVSAACGFFAAREVGAYQGALVCAALCLGLVAAALRPDTPWERVFGALALAGGACALGGRLETLAYPIAAWPCFSLGLVASALVTHEVGARWPLGLAAFAIALVPAHLVFAYEGRSLSSVFVAAALLAGAAWLVGSIEVRLEPTRPADVGPYRDAPSTDTWRSRNSN